MKKKILIVLSIVVVLLISVGLVKSYVDNARERNSEKVPITHQAAIEIVKKTLDSKSMETITNLDNPKIEAKCREILRLFLSCAIIHAYWIGTQNINK